ncbi:MAG: hypothetical protein E6R03_03720 [Hyphomicrobiaceae bacterium]|nr:MAG: hypothetical protein E6R03_03720 [Hyphomicrobiaceae bacterium]
MSKRPRVRQLWLSLGIFEMDVCVVITPDLDDFRTWMIKKFGPRSVDTMQSLHNGNTQGLCMVNVNGSSPVIWLRRVPYTAQDLATLAHESVHTLVNVFGYYGVPIDEKNDEVFAHAMGPLMRSVLTTFRKRKKVKA